jgi:hypothetical protein
MALTSAAQEPPLPENLFLGWGHRTCRTSIALNELRVESGQMQWVFGFIAGAAATARQVAINTGNRSEFVRRLPSYDEDRLAARVAAACRADPDRKLYEAADVVIGELQGG